VERSDPIQEDEPSFVVQPHSLNDLEGFIDEESGPRLSPSERAEYVPKELFLRQQQIISSLQEQVEGLQNEIASLQKRLSDQGSTLPSVNLRLDVVPPSPHLYSHSDEREMSFREEEESEEEVKSISQPHQFRFPSHEVEEEVEEEDESFVYRDPFEKCEMEAPSIFNFDFFVRTLKDRNGESSDLITHLLSLICFSKIHP
jgi:hypothetical protein